MDFLTPTIMALGTGASMIGDAKNRKKQAVTERIETPEQRKARQALMSVAMQTLSGGTSPQEQKLVDQAATQGQSAVANALRAYENNPTSAGGNMQNFQESLADSLIKSRITASNQASEKMYDDAFHAGLQMALQTPAKGQTTGTKNNKGDIWGSLAGGLGLVSSFMPSGGGAKTTATTTPVAPAANTAWTPNFTTDPRFKLRY